MVASRLERSRQSGLHAVVDASQEEAENAVRRLTGERGADTGFESTRSPAAFRTLLRMAALGGRVVMVGSVHATAELDLFEDLQRKELTIIGAWQPRAPIVAHPQYRWSQETNRQVFLDLLQTGTVQVDHLITHRARPAEAVALYETMAAGAGEWMGVLFAWDQ
ncbi:MAG TPA: zinc-binding dehydrogenase [Chloroflexota bacterium]|nr:zinc-binding dehydrogenase [Chloroflexota bacterium]